MLCSLYAPITHRYQLRKKMPQIESNDGGTKSSTFKSEVHPATPIDGEKPDSNVMMTMMITMKMMMVTMMVMMMTMIMTIMMMTMR